MGNYCKTICAVLMLAGAFEVATSQELDTRLAIHLSPAEKQWLLNDMRGHSTAIATINAALGAGDTELARVTASAHGMLQLNDPDRPPNFRAKTNPTWNGLAASLHKDFDAVAQGIANHEDASQTFARMGKLMQNCIACHAAHKVDTP